MNTGQWNWFEILGSEHSSSGEGEWTVEQWKTLPSALWNYRPKAAPAKPKMRICHWLLRHLRSWWFSLVNGASVTICEKPRIGGGNFQAIQLHPGRGNLDYCSMQHTPWSLPFCLQGFRRWSSGPQMTRAREAAETIHLWEVREVRNTRTHNNDIIKSQFTFITKVETGDNDMTMTTNQQMWMTMTQQWSMQPWFHINIGWQR